MKSIRVLPVLVTTLLFLASCGSSDSPSTSTPPPQAVDGTCGSNNGAALSAAPTTNLCGVGTASAVSGTGPWAWMCTGSNGGTTASCQATLASTPANGACGTANGTAVSSTPTMNLCSVGTASTVAGSGPWNWMCASTNGGTTASCQAPLATTPANGACGTANNVAVSSTPTTNLCSVGTASTVAGNGPWNWMCASTNGGTTASCQAPLASTPVNGACGAANNVAVSSKPTANLCSVGTASTVAGTGPWTWMCPGSNGGTTASCQAPLASTPVNGVCGLADGIAVSTAPTTNLCSTGTATSVTGSGPWNWMCTGSNGGLTPSCSAPLAGGGSGGGAPVLIQHIASSANPVGLGISGNNFNIPLPNTVLGGDALVLAMTFPHGNTSTVTDSLGQSWPAATIVKDGGAGNYLTQVYVLCGAVGGNETIHVALTSASIPFEYTVSEFNNVATTGCVDGSVGGTNITPSSAVISPGAFTPGTNNDANGGHVIWSYTAISTNASGNPTSWTPATGFTLLDGDIAWVNKQGFPHASQWTLQTANAAVTPSITSTGDSSDSFNSVAVALKVASAGGTMPSGIHINKILHLTWAAVPASTLNLQLPTTGNLRVLAFPGGSNLSNITSVTDSEGGTWILKEASADSPQIWYSANRPANPGLIVSLHSSGSSPTDSVRFFDIQGAAASPFDVFAGTASTDCTSATTINNQPTITPSGANELVIATMGIGDGPGLGLASGAPSGAAWDLVTYAGELDLDLMENADALGHLYTTSGAVENWNWKITPNGTNSCFAAAIAFK